MCHLQSGETSSRQKMRPCIHGQRVQSSRWFTEEGFKQLRHAHAQTYVYQIISVVYLPAYDPVIFASWYLTVVAQQKSYVILKICEEAVGLSGKISGAM
jgi:hypothetical protein